MKTKLYCIVTVCLLGALGHRNVTAQNLAMDSLRTLVGVWDVRSAVSTPDGWHYADTTTQATFTVLLAGQLVQEEVLITTPAFSFEMHMLYAYDQSRKVYRMAATDKQGGLMDIYEGAYEGADLIFTNLRHETFFTTPDGREIAFRLRKEPLANDRFALQADMSDNRGETWMPYTRSEYTRIEQR